MMAIKLKITLAALLLTACSTLKDNYGECGAWLEFVFDHNMEYIDSFSRQVSTIELAVFDSDGRPVRNLHADVASLDGRKRMWLAGLPQGRYTVLTVGNFTDEHFLLNNATLAEASLALKEASASREFPHLFGGGPVQVDVDAKGSVTRVPMMRHTNRFNIALETTAPATRQAAKARTAHIVAPEAGVYDLYDRPVDRRKIVYRPYTLRQAAHTTDAKINTMRLLESEDGYRIAVHDVDSETEIWGRDLLPLLAATKPAKRPDGSILPNAEYLDREGEWNIVIVNRGGTNPDGSEAFVATRIIVNGWVVWQNGMDL